jgi:ribonucleotide reductase beta subunit family protein with ferritin-like domain
MGLFDERIPYKPFEYPEYYTEGWLKQAQAFWLHTEIPMSGDVKDWNEKLTESEKNLVGNILLGFAQTECAVSDYWTQKVVSWFPKHEIQQMAMMFGSQETIHAVAYSYLNETLGLENFEAFLHEPATAERFENLISYSGNDPVGIGRSLAIFSAFAEGVSLYSAFAVLYSFQMRNLLKGIGQQMKWSVRDESLHSKNILTKCLNKEILKTLKPTISNNLLEKDLMKNCKNLVTWTSGNTLRLTKKEQQILTGSIILPGGTLILIFLLFARLIIPKQMREKILKIFGNEEV